MRDLLILTFAILVIILAAYRNPALFRELVSRDGSISSKKVFFCVACVTATVCLLWITYKGIFEPWAYIVLYLIYLACIGGMETVPKMMAMVIEYKTGKPATSTTETSTTTSTKTEAQ